MESDQNNLLTEFVSVTGADRERAQFYLESAGWKLEVALASFFDNDGDEDMEEPQAPPAQAQAARPHQTSRPTAPSRFGTIGGLKGEEKKDDSQGQEYYAGGSLESGEVIIGPPSKKKTSAAKFVEDMMQSAREHGAEEVPAAPPAQENTSSAFVGSGFRLGESETAPSQMVQGKNAPRKKVAVVLKLWKTGFSVDDGGLRDYQDKDNKEFLDSIHNGSIPHELLSLAEGGEVNLDMEDHRDEDFVAPKHSMKAFTGSGHMLGSPAPTVVSTSPALSEKHEAMAKQTVTVDPSKPTTKLQIRLADGTRLVGNFNHSHRVADVRNYILTARPLFGAGSFTLLTTFPNKVITDEQQTLVDAQLLNAVIVQRMK